MATLPEARRRPLATILPLLVIFAIVVAIVLTLFTFRTPSPSRPGALQVAPLESGQLAPNFSLRNVQKDAPPNPVSLSQLLQNGPVVLIFNMGLHCSACAGELAAFAAQIQDFQSARVQVVAISDEDPSETLEYLETLPAIPFPLLYDPDNSAARAYGLVSPSGGVEERTFYVDETQHIRHAYKPDQPGGEIPRLLALKSQLK